MNPCCVRTVRECVKEISTIQDNFPMLLRLNLDLGAGIYMAKKHVERLLPKPRKEGKRK